MVCGNPKNRIFINVKQINMKTYKKIARQQVDMEIGTEVFDGESIEQKCRRATQSNEPIEAISPMIYTERKEGVRADTNIRTDKFDIAQQAMSTIADGVREKRNKRLEGKDKPAAKYEVNAQTTVNQ